MRASINLFSTRNLHLTAQFTEEELLLLRSACHHKKDWHKRGLDFDNPAHEGYKNNEKAIELYKALVAKIEGMLNV